MLDTNGNEIQSFLRIVISFQADASAMMNGWIVYHFYKAKITIRV